MIEGDNVEHLQIFTIILEGVVGLAVSYVGWKIKKIRESEKELAERKKRESHLELLNTKMILIREIEHYKEKGFAPVYAQATISEMYQDYHRLGGNGGLEKLFLEFKNLPTSEVKE